MDGIGGQGHLDEVINIATYLDDNDITKLVLINKLNEIKYKWTIHPMIMFGRKRNNNHKLQDILDKEKQVKDEK